MIISLVVLGSQSELCFFESSSSSLPSVGRELRDNMLYLEAFTLIIIVGIFMSMSELWISGALLRILRLQEYLKTMVYLRV